MRLIKISIAGFRSIKSEEHLILDERINILIGANDHGKTNLIEAIRCLNDDRPITEADLNWDLPADQPTRIIWHFSVVKGELDQFEEIVIIPDEKADLFPVNQQNEVIFIREGVGKPVKVESVPIRVSKQKEKELLAMRPRVELFEAPKNNLIDKVTREQLTTAPFEFMQGIFMLAGIWEKRDSIFSESDVNLRLLDEASVRLNDVIKDKWNQGNDLIWKLKHTGTNGNIIEIKLQDPSITTRYIRPSLKSAGFQTYFLISMIVLARTQNNKGKYIFLFDEPGTFLHPAAQMDLQRSFEIISDNAQIVYTTHSVFLINKNYPSRNRVVSKTIEGTKIDQKPFQKNWKAVRSSLGILLSNNFLISEKTLLVEGPSDVIYIYDAIRRAKAEKNLDLDINDLSIVDAGATDNYIAMAKVMLSEGRKIVALIDGDNSGQTIKRKLENTCKADTKSKNLIIQKLPENKSIEDIFADVDSLHESIVSISKEFVDEKIRELQEGVNLEKFKLKKSGTKTLGKIIDEETSKLFKEGEKLSKLSIALRYEDICKDRNVLTSEEALGILLLLKTNLSIKGERSAEAGVFEEVQ